MNIFKLIWYYLTSHEEYLHEKRSELRMRVMARHNAMKRHVYVQDIYHYCHNSKKHWQMKSYIVVDGLIICEYTSAIEDYFAELYNRYYTLHRHHLLNERL